MGDEQFAQLEATPLLSRSPRGSGDVVGGGSMAAATATSAADRRRVEMVALIGDSGGLSLHLLEEFQTMSAALNRRLADIQRGAGGDLKDAFQEAEADAYDAQNTLKKLEQEVRQLPYHSKAKGQAKLDGYQSDFNKQLARLRSLKASGGTDDGSGSGSAATGGVSRADRKVAQEQRNKLLGARAVTEDTNASLARTAAALGQTEEIGADTARTLMEQREALIVARDTIRETDDFLVRSQKTLRRIRRRLMTNKLITGFIILIQLCAIALIVWLKWYK